MDRFETMRVFAKIAEIGSFAGAAARLDISPSMASQHVKVLEESLGVRLLNRTTRQVNLTEIGREYYERCTQILVEVDEADRIASALQLAPRGRLRVYCDTNIARFIAPVVTHFLENFQDATIDLRPGDRMPGLVEEGFDLAIRAVVPADSSLIVRRLAEWRHILCCTPGYLETILHRCTSPTSPRITACDMRITHSATTGISPTERASRQSCVYPAIS